MAQPLMDYRTAVGIGVRRGTVVAFDDDARPLVRAHGHTSAILCDCLDSGIGTLQVSLGDTVCFATYENDEAGCILGRVGGNAPRASVLRLSSLKFEVDEFIVDAKGRVTIGTQAARLVLDAKGNLESMAVSIVSRARRLHKLLAPMIRLN